MDDFKAWLVGQQFSESSVSEHERAINYFKQWLKSQSLEIETVVYQTLLDYIKISQEKGNESGSINNNLNSINKYFEFLNLGYNPAHKLMIKTRRKRIKYLSKETLNSLYEIFISKDKFLTSKHAITHKRDGIILGLMIYQGIDTATLKRLRVDHIDLNKGSVYLPETRKSNSRAIGLQSKQMLEIIRYLEFIKTDLLIEKNVSRIVQDLFRKLRKTNDKIENIYQIRGSVIANWLSEGHLREVQYLAGHKHISSTEHYIKQDVSVLRKNLVQAHPLRK